MEMKKPDRFYPGRRGDEFLRFVRHPL
jgi:hypothetical protein